MTLGEMMRRMSAKEFAGWIAYDHVEPLDDGWLQHAELTSVVYNAWRGPKSPALSARDFLPGLRFGDDARQEKGQPLPDNGFSMLCAMAGVDLPPPPFPTDQQVCDKWP